MDNATKIPAVTRFHAYPWIAWIVRLDGCAFLRLQQVEVGRFGEQQVLHLVVRQQWQREDGQERYLWDDD